MYSDGDLHKGGVAPFGYPRIKACSRLPMAFRSVPRPSSPPGAKASTECPYRAQNPHDPSPEGSATPTMHRNHPQKQTASNPSQNCEPQTRTKSHTHFTSRPCASSPRSRASRQPKGYPSPRQTCRPRYAHKRTRTYSIAKDQHPRSRSRTTSGSLHPSRRRHIRLALPQTTQTPRPENLGGGGRDRTDDPLLAKQVLSQLSYTPNSGGPGRT